MSGVLILSALMMTVESGEACAAPLRVTTDSQTFAAAPAPPAEAIGRVVTQATGAACRAGWLSAQDLAGYDTLLVQHGEGATEPFIYFDEARGWRTLVLQFAFREGAVPSAEKLASALRCWKEPEREECYAG